jgi:peptide/nickel transport system substrate-binding protein
VSRHSLKQMHLRSLVLISIIALALALSSCGGTSEETTTTAAVGGGSTSTTAADQSATTTSQSGGGESTAPELVMFTPGGAATNFDPANASMNIFNMLAPVYDTLIRRASDGSFEPNLATSWEYTSPTTFKLTLQKGISFIDGTPFNADAVIANIENVKKGAGAYSSQFGVMATLKAVDDYTVEIELAQPDPTIPVLLSTASGMMASPKAIGTPSLATTPVGTGPYTYNAAESVTDDTLIYDLRDDYWNPGHYHFDKVVLRVFADESAAANAITAGEVDIAEFGQPSAVVRVKGAGLSFTGAPFNVWGLNFLDLDGKLVPALGDVRVRQALNYAIDRQAIVDTVNQGVGAATTQIIKPWMEGYDAALENAYAYDSQKATQLLKDAGHDKGFSFEAVSMSFFDQYAQAVQSYLAQVGVDMKIVNVPPDQYISSIFSGKYPTAILPWGAIDTYFDFGQLFLPDAGFNPLKFDLPEFNDLYAQAARASDADRPAILAQINKLIVEQAWTLRTSGDLFGYGYHSDRVVPTEWVGLRPYFLYDWMPAQL